jgi:hypothetical protein
MHIPSIVRSPHFTALGETTASRALQILEAIGSEEAVQNLRRIEMGVPSRNARAARAALARLGK